MPFARRIQNPEGLYFITFATVGWVDVFTRSRYIDIVLESLKYCQKEKGLILYGYVIMSNHIHIIWQPLQHYTLTQIQSSFARHTAKQIKKKISEEQPHFLQRFKVNKYDREYQIWKREPLSIELFTEKVFHQKMEYIHNNPVAAQLVHYPEEYKYSSARFYQTGLDEFNLVTHYMGD